ncbi:MAG: 16S rRNA (uracil(1498)-N(3))-methyltransferase [Opitutaceae bacterium]
MDGEGTIIDVSGLASIKNITFDSPLVAAYTIGAGAANSQTAAAPVLLRIEKNAGHGGADMVKAAVERGFKPVSLGFRVLKSDTAGLFALSAIDYEYSK